MSETSTEDAATQVFLDHRRLLFSVVYNLLGSIADTEEVLQETWLAWTRHSDRLDADEIENPRAYLVRVAVNQEMAQVHTAIHQGDEIAFFPPVTGG